MEENPGKATVPPERFYKPYPNYLVEEP